MRNNKLGRTGLYVSELCLGTMTFGGGEPPWNSIGGLDQAAAERLVGRAVDAGITFIDTADVYASGASERITGQALRNLKVPRENVVIATKGYGPTGPGANARGNSRVHLIDAVKASLKRLQMDHIDLYQVHGFDPATPIEETVRALDILVQHGHVRYVGASNWAAWQMMKALGIADRQGLARFDCLQAYYSLAGRDIEREIVPMLRSEGVGLMVWGPLASGLLSGKYGRGDQGEGRRAAIAFPPADEGRAYACIDAMRPMAAVRGVSVARIALAWLLHQPAVSSVIVGVKRMDQLDDNLGAAEIDLTAEELGLLDTASALPREYPGWMFDTQAGRAKQLSEAGRGTIR